MAAAARRRHAQLGWHGQALIDARFTVKGAKRSNRAIGALGRTEKQISGRLQGKMEGPADMLLQFPVKIDQHIPA